MAGILEFLLKRQDEQAANDNYNALLSREMAPFQGGQLAGIQPGETLPAPLLNAGQQQPQQWAPSTQFLAQAAGIPGYGNNGLLTGAQSGLNQLANTRLSNQGQLDNTALSNSGNIALQNLRGQQATTLADTANSRQVEADRILAEARSFENDRSFNKISAKDQASLNLQRAQLQQMQDFKLQDRRIEQAKLFKDALGTDMGYTKAIETGQELLSHPGLNTAAGFKLVPGYVMRSGTPAANFKATLDTYVAQNVLPVLQSGAAKGSTSDRDMLTFAASAGTFDLSQSPEQLRANLKKVQDYLGSTRKLHRAFNGITPAMTGKSLKDF